MCYMIGDLFFLWAESFHLITWKVYCIVYVGLTSTYMYWSLKSMRAPLTPDPRVWMASPFSLNHLVFSFPRAQEASRNKLEAEIDQF